MDRVFSVDDIPDHFWGTPPSRPPPIHDHDHDHDHDDDVNKDIINRSSSEWCFQRFLQEASNATSAPNPPPPPPSQKDTVSQIIGQVNNGGVDGEIINSRIPVKTTAYQGQDIPVDSEEYQALLRNKLVMACQAVAITRASGTRPQESAGVAPGNLSQLPASVQIISQASPAGSGTDLPKKQVKDDGQPTGKPSLPASQNKSCVQVRSTASWSSGDQSDDDDEVDGETTENVDPVDAKRMRRKLSNRISAQRSRKRKQNHQTELETQVSQLTDEHSLLLKRLSVSSQKYNEAAVDNRVLKADVETLRAKVKMAEETVKRITGFNPFIQSMSEISMSMLPSYAGGSSDASTDYLPPSHNHMHSHNLGIPNRLVDIVPVDSVQHPPVESAAVAGSNNVAITSSVQRVASLEHLQKCIRGELSSGDSRGDESRNEDSSWNE